MGKLGSLITWLPKISMQLNGTNNANDDASAITLRASILFLIPIPLYQPKQSDTLFGALSITICHRPHYEICKACGFLRAAPPLWIDGNGIALIGRSDVHSDILVEIGFNLDVAAFAQFT